MGGAARSSGGGRAAEGRVAGREAAGAGGSHTSSMHQQMKATSTRSHKRPHYTPTPRRTHAHRHHIPPLAHTRMRAHTQVRGGVPAAPTNSKMTLRRAARGAGTRKEMDRLETCHAGQPRGTAQSCHGSTSPHGAGREGWVGLSRGTHLRGRRRASRPLWCPQQQKELILGHQPRGMHVHRCHGGRHKTALALGKPSWIT